MVLVESVHLNMQRHIVTFNESRFACMLYTESALKRCKRLNNASLFPFLIVIIEQDGDFQNVKKMCFNIPQKGLISGLRFKNENLKK